METAAIDRYTDMAIDMAVKYAPKVLLALLVLWIGGMLIKWSLRIMDRSLEKRGTDVSLRGFLRSLVSALLRVLLIVSVIQMLGVATTSFVAIIGAAGLAVGLALQGTLANFAGGVLLLLFKPYKVGDLIQAQGELGVVKDIQIFVTILLSPQNKTIIVPNGAMANGNITNFTSEGLIRVDLSCGIGYGEDIKKAREVLLDVMNNDEYVLADPAPSVAVSNLGDSSVDLALRPWCKPEHYWNVYSGTLEKGKEALDRAGIEIPFPQRVVHNSNKG
jgi:small conductance mechanosensitive channel